MSNEASEVPPERPSRGYLFRIVYLAACFNVLFIAYTVSANFVTSLHPNDGFQALAFLYVTFAFASPLAPSITAKLGIKTSICLGASTYSAWIVVSLFPYSWVFMLSSMMLGLGAAVLWNQQSLYMTLTAQAAGTQFTGYLTGLFWTCFSVSSLIGNVISISVIASGASTTSLLWILAGIGCVSVVMFFFVPSPHTRPDSEPAAVDVESASTEKPEADSPPESITDRIKSLRACFALPHVPWICLYSAYLGINGSFSGATLPTFVDVSRIPTLFLLYSIASILTSWSIGMVFDRWGWPVIVGIQVIGNVFPHISFLSVSNPRTDLPFGYLLAVGAVYGVSDSITNTLLNTTVSRVFAGSGKKNEAMISSVFALLRLFQGNATAIGCSVARLPYVAHSSLCLAFSPIAVYSYQRFWKQYNELSQTDADIELEIAPQVSIVEVQSKPNQIKSRAQLAPKSKSQVSAAVAPAQQLSERIVAFDPETLHMDERGVIRIVGST